MQNKKIYTEDQLLEALRVQGSLLDEGKEALKPSMWDDCFESEDECAEDWDVSKQHLGFGIGPD